MNATKKRENIIFIAELIIKTITVILVILMAASVIAMVEAWSISGAPLVAFIRCLAWIGIINAYKFIVKK